MTTITIKAGEVMADVRSAGWLEQELHPEADRHRRHQMADICEEGNVEHVWRVLGIRVAEVRLALSALLLPETFSPEDDELQQREEWEFRFRSQLTEMTATYLREKIHEYLVAGVMADRTAVILPEGSAVWQLRASEALASLRSISATAGVGTARRPLWPF